MSSDQSPPYEHPGKSVRLHGKSNYVQYAILLL